MSESTPAAEERERTPRLLVVDDDPATAQLIRGWFADSMEVLDASDGEQGLERTLESLPDLLLLDLRMPGLDGIAVAQQLKRDSRTRTIPIVVLSACRDTDSKVEAFSAGADDYITKPFEVQEVDARVRSMLRKREALLNMESAVRDLTSTNERLEQLLMVDEKTGLYNFREFQRRLKAEWSRAERYGVPLSLVFFDLDHFKQINDTLGHQAGDKILEEFALLVTGGARANDVAARYGGEEFAVILPHTELGMALRVAERIRRAVDDFTFTAGDSSTSVSVSGGVATYPGGAGVDSMDALVRAADAALYRAKDEGRNRIVVCETGAPGAVPHTPKSWRRRSPEASS
ncbi:MAG: diguanylate cyclase [Acidobacteria bacterium]|nr:diguanylate cyclase [Acidobacteriota bacterium]NIM60265.1 diguanylate cyclase [Acidobacteriota bacterium]NIO60303.1 diguanylate cyclase [Acidobacteriota bacterium]NIQ31358.1 diguanylate cyclase [Acidobacteriota bacterium]NIQ86581.1 diguanylate cyclase [Acidobacteriota bacterium]